MSEYNAQLPLPGPLGWAEDGGLRSPRRREPVAIVGIGCRLPGGITSAEELWTFLRKGRNAIAEVPSDRWDTEALFAWDNSQPGRTYVRRGGFLDGIDRFDPQFFGISAREAAHIDPQQRLLLETAYEALEDSGTPTGHLPLRRTGVFVGVMFHDYQAIQLADRQALVAHTGTGTAMSIAANRISYAFDLHGPSVAVDTACSSSLVAVDLACKALVAGECDYALAGGANAILSPEWTIALSKANMLAKDGQCKAFSAKADGYARAEGAGMVVLRRLTDAVAAGDRIYAVIAGSATNSDGRTAGISVPNGQAQEELTRSVLAAAAVPPASVGYVEAHGTGTPTGDPIECTALGNVFSAGRPSAQPCLIGSVKSNLGHLESAAGIAGLIKAALVVSTGEIPASLHFDEPNPAIDFERLKLRVVTELEPWPASDRLPRRAAVNSFGFGGTNAHVLLEQAPEVPGVNTPESVIGDKPLILPMGAHTATALKQLAGAYADLLAEGANARDLIYTAAVRRTHGRQRTAVVAHSVEDLQAQLSALADTGREGETPATQSNKRLGNGPVFVFSGMGTQWWAMGRRLLTSSPVFREAVEQLDEKFQRHANWSIVSELLMPEPQSRINEAHIAQPAIFALQVGLTELWRHFGVEAAAALGHSAGEIAALWASGTLSLDDAVAVAYHRSRLQGEIAGSGGMLAVNLTPAEAEAAIAGLDGVVSIAAVNAPAALTLAGDLAALESLKKRLDSQGVFARVLQVDVPYHSPFIDPIEQRLRSVLDTVSPESPRIPYYSATDRHPSVALGGADYWWRNTRYTVRFADAVGLAIDDGHAVFLEIGAHPALTALIQECARSRGWDATTLASLKRNKPEVETMWQALAELHRLGSSVAWEQVVAPGKVISLGPYPFQRERHWSESPQHTMQRRGLNGTAQVASDSRRHPLIGAKLDLATPVWLQTVDPRGLSYLHDHQIRGAAVYPGAAYLEMVLHMLGQSEPSGCLSIEDVGFQRALYLDDRPVTLQTTLHDGQWEIHARHDGESVWTRHAAGHCANTTHTNPHTLDLEAVTRRCTRVWQRRHTYQLLKDIGLDYGPAFRSITEVRRARHEALAKLALPTMPSAGTADDSAMFFHPALLDGCLHTLFAALDLEGDDGDYRGNTFLPTAIRSIRFYRRPTSQMWSHALIHHRSPTGFEGDLFLFDQDLQLVAEVASLRCQALEDPTEAHLRRLRQWVYRYRWMEQPPIPVLTAMSSRPWLVFASDLDHPLLKAMAAHGLPVLPVVAGDDFGWDGAHGMVRPGEPADFRRLLGEVGANGGELQGIVHAFCLAQQEQETAPHDLQIMGAGSLLHLTQSMVSQIGGTSAEVPLWVATSPCHTIVDSDTTNVGWGSVWGLRRAIANEHPSLSARIADLDNDSASFIAFCRELNTGPDGDDELGFRTGRRFVQRLERHEPHPADPQLKTEETTFRADASYLITGGITGFGRELALWMAAHGAGRLVLLNRRGPRTPGVEQVVAGLAALGCQAHIEACDISDPDHLAMVLSRVPEDRPLRGVFHAAAVIDDALITNIDLDRYATSFLPKALGAWHLHRQTLPKELDYFMCFSSVSSMLGIQGNANYAAANAFVDALMRQRHHSGLAGLAVNWGVIADVGMAADENHRRDNLERQGLHAIHTRPCLQLLGTILRTKEPQLMVASIDFPRWLETHPAGAGGRFSAMLAPTGVDAGTDAATAARSTDADSPLRQRLAGLAPHDRQTVAREVVTSVLAEVLRTSTHKIDSSDPLVSLGLDSLLAVELKNRLDDLGLKISVTQLLSRNTGDSLAEHLLEAFGHADAPAVTAATRPTSSPWFVRRRPRDNAKIRLICVPFAGAGATAYHRWPDDLPDWIDIVTVALPARGTRMDEQPIASLPAVAEEMIPDLLPLLDRPFAFYGHCMGAVLAYEVCRRLQETYHKSAVHLFASGSMAPHLYTAPVVHEQNDGKFLEVLQLIGFTTTKALLQDAQLRQTMFPMLRGDFKAVTDYGQQFQPGQKLDANITGLAADEDLFSPPNAMDAWSNYTTGRFDLAVVPGDHYFVETHRDTVTALVQMRLAQALDVSPAASLTYNGMTWRAVDNTIFGFTPSYTSTAPSLHGRGRRLSPGPAEILCFPPDRLNADEWTLPTSTDDVVYETVDWRGASTNASPRTVADMVHNAYKTVRDRCHGKTVFYGQGVGAIVAYELAQRLQAERRSMPGHLLSVGAVPPHLYIAPNAHKLPTEKLLELLRVLEHPYIDRLESDAGYLAERIGTLRADLQAMANYRWQHDQPLAIPITVVCLRLDLWCYPSFRLDRWKYHTTKRCRVVEWPGDHYYATRNPHLLHQLIENVLATTD